MSLMNKKRSELKKKLLLCLISCGNKGIEIPFREEVGSGVRVSNRCPFLVCTIVEAHENNG